MLFNRIIKFFVTAGYVGLIPFVPGTFGTLVAIPFFYFLSINFYLYTGMTAGIIILGIWWSGIAEEKIFGTSDSREIVIDEVAGYLIAMAFFVPSDGWYYILIGFILFRIFDILKPFPINQLQNLKSGYGIMADDILAGIYTNLLLQLIRLIV